MRLSYRLTVDDVAEGLRLHRRGFRHWMNLLWLLFLLPAVVFIALDGPPFLVLVPIAVVGLFWLLLRGLDRATLASQLRKTPGADGDLELELLDNGVRMQNSAGGGETAWGALHGWRANSKVLLLYHDPNLYRTIPLRAVPEELRGELRSLVAGHLTEVGAAAPRAAARLPEPVEPCPGSRFAVRYLPDEAELDEAFGLAVRTMPGNRRSFLLVAGLGLLLLGWNGYALFTEGGSTLAQRLPWMLCGAWFLAMRPFKLALLRRSYRSVGAVRDERQIDLLEEGLRLRTATSDAFLPWNGFTGWVAGERILLLYLGPGLFHFLPRRLATEEFLQSLRERLGPPLS